MNDLTIIKVNGGAYIDSREVAKAIGKDHNHLMRDIREYLRVMRKTGASKIGYSEFFVESTYISSQNKVMPCFLLSKMGCEMVANKLTGDKGILFSAEYIKRFNAMEAAERAAEIKNHAKPRLGEFNSAVRNVLAGMSYNYSKPSRVMSFLRGVYEPLGIDVQVNDDNSQYLTATQIAWLHGIYSESGRPHGHAVSAIISKLDNPARHAIVVPYGLVGVTVRYDSYIVDAVWNWIVENEYPFDVPCEDFCYHIYYNCQESLYDDGCSIIRLDSEFGQV